MNNVLSPFVLGLITYISLFCVCTFLVLGAKITFITLKNFINTFSQNKQPINPEVKQPKPTPKKRSKSIEIDADQFDRIYFKKSS